MSELLKKIKDIGIVPVIVLEDVADALPLAEALIEGGLPCAEVTFRTAAAEDSIRAICQAYPEMLVGAGTVLTTDQVDRAMAAGAKFAVSPGFNPRIVKYCQEKGLPIVPGCSSPTDIEQALEHGLKVVKFFPAEQLGGLPMIKALAGPYVDVEFMPTGGINAGNVKDYLGYKRILACGGSWMVKSDLIQAGDFDRIVELVKEAKALVEEARGGK